METPHWILLETSLDGDIYQERKPCICSSIGVVCWTSRPTGSWQFLLLTLTTTSVFLSTGFSVFPPLLLVCLVFSLPSISPLHPIPLPIRSTQTSQSWRTSASRAWATPPSASAGHRSTPQPSLVTGSRWWQPARAYPSLRTWFCRRPVNTPFTDWSPASATTSAWPRSRRMARASPPQSHSRPVRSMFPSNQEDFFFGVNSHVLIWNSIKLYIRIPNCHSCPLGR